VKRSRIAAGIFAALTLGVAAAAFAHPGEAGGGMGMHGNAGMQHAMHGAGQQSMRSEERSALMEKMRSAKTPEERHQLVEGARAEMQQRAKEKAATTESNTHTH
jgi:hypothetical protein